MHLDVINCKPKVRFFNHNIQPVKSDVLIFHFVCIKNRRHGDKGLGDQSSERDLHVAESTQIDFQPSYYVMLQSPGIYHYFLAAQCSESRGSILEDVLRCKLMEERRPRLLQTKLQSAVRRQSAPDCYKRHDLFCPETILRLNIIQTEKYCL